MKICPCRNHRKIEQRKIAFTAVSLFLSAASLLAQDALTKPSPWPSASPGEGRSEAVIVSATRFDLPLDQSPASASLITGQEIEIKQIQRVSDALREVP